MSKYAYLNNQLHQYYDHETIFDFANRVLQLDKIPSLCQDDQLKPFGSCRLCSVEVAFMEHGATRTVASCHTPVTENSYIYTKSEKIVKLRQNILELVASTVPQHQIDIQDSKKPTELQKVFQQHATPAKRYPSIIKESITSEDHPYIKMDMQNCIHCFKCIRACDEIQGQFVLQRWQRGYQGVVLPGLQQKFDQSACVSCGVCVQICPTEALYDRYHSKTQLGEQITRTVCTYCGVGCNLEVTQKENRVLAIEGAKDAKVNAGHTCVKGRFAFEFYRHPDRIKSPMIRKNGLLEEVSWDEAFDFIAENLQKIKTEFGGHTIGGLSSARCTNEENYLMQKFLRIVLQSNNIDCCARVCHAPTAFGMRQTFGTGAATNSIEEIKYTNCLLVVGANPTEAHPVTGAKIKQRALDGIPMIIIDPRKIELTDYADIHLQLKPGTNLALLNMLSYYIIKECLYDTDFINSRTTEFETYKNEILSLDLDSLEQLTGVDRQLVKQAATIYAKASNAMIFHGLGVTEHFQGSKTVMALSALAMLTGNIGKVGAGVNPLRGQNNVQGAADMGCQPDLGAGYLDFTVQQNKTHFEQHYHARHPMAKGLMAPEMFGEAIAGNLKALWIMGEDIMQSDPNTNHIEMALKNLQFLVVQELFHTDTTALAHVVLPAASFLEKSGTFTNGERRIQKVNQVVKPQHNSKPDGEIITKMMQKMGYPQPDFDPASVLEEISQVVPFFQGVNRENLNTNGLQWPVKMGGLDTKILHTEQFSRGLGKFIYNKYQPSPEFELHGSEFPLILTTGRILEHYNCGTMTRRTPNQHLHAEDVLLINPFDAKHYKVNDGQHVTLASARGKISIKAQISEQVKPGVLYTTFHHPETEANKITSCIMDKDSLTPEYKVVAVRIE